MKKRGLCILLSGMMIFSSAPYGGTKEVKAAGEGESQTSAETVKEENTETEATSFEKTVVYEQDGITVTITDFKDNTLYYTVKNESEKEIFAEVLKIEVNGQVIRDISNEKDSAYQGLSIVETGAVSGEEKEVNRNLFELDELQIKEFEEIGVVFGIIEVTGDKNNPMERRYSEIACTDTITVKTPKEDAAEDPMNEFGVTGEQLELLNKLVNEAVKTEYLEPHGIPVEDFSWEPLNTSVWQEFAGVSFKVMEDAYYKKEDIADNLEELVETGFTSMKDSEPAAYDLANAVYHSFYLKWLLGEKINVEEFFLKLGPDKTVGGPGVRNFLMEHVTIK